MQVDPNAATILVNTPAGGLVLDPGRQVVARVVEASAGGNARISLAGQTFAVQTDAALRAGDDVHLTVTKADADGVRLAMTQPGSSGSSGGATAGSPGNTIVAELARAGVPVTPQIARAVSAVLDQLGATDQASARAAASLAGRGIALSPAAAGRVAAALELAGSIGPALASLASVNGDVAAALPAGTPTAAALRGLLAPNLTAAELAMARIAQATQASAPGGPVNLPAPPASSPAVIANYVASQVAVNAHLDALASQNTVLGTQSLLAARGQLPQPAGEGGLAPAALQAAIRGQAAAGAVDAGAAVDDVRGRTVSPPPLTATAAASALQQSAAKAGATAAAATGAAAGGPPQTPARAAQAIADLATLATRFAAAVAPGAGALGQLAAQGGRGVNQTEIAQLAGPQGAAASLASVGGSGAGGEATPLVTALQAFLASQGGAQDAARLLRTLTGADPALLQAAIRSLPETSSLQLAGRLLDALAAAGVQGAAAGELRAGVHGALELLGRSMQPRGGDELTTLRMALEAAAGDARPAVAAEATRLLHALDGQQLLSRSATGADPGYVYFQLPLPDGRGAEVLVRRDPGRRQVTFEEFNIAFLLDTESLGSLMISLDAHPSGIRADVRTDVAELEPFLRAHADALAEPLGREARRPVVVTTGVFDDEPPTSLLEPTLGLVPGANEFYA